MGASQAGLSVARSLRKQGCDGRLVAIGEKPHRPCDRTPLSRELLTGTMDESELTLEADGEDLGVEWILDMTAGLTGVHSLYADRGVRLLCGTGVRGVTRKPREPLDTPSATARDGGRERVSAVSCSTSAAAFRPTSSWGSE
ncbi:hypothetical protein ACFYWX_34180 [Streptomyces sp. NPDC002888]|uniref:hypothetical protein n=1 Tax=Streptomyces sp. NPDC002888 TaxID=3364668 RepID=UPI00367C2A9F